MGSLLNKVAGFQTFRFFLVFLLLTLKSVCLSKPNICSSPPLHAFQQKNGVTKTIDVSFSLEPPSPYLGTYFMSGYFKFTTHEEQFFNFIIGKLKVNTSENY